MFKPAKTNAYRCLQNMLIDLLIIVCSSNVVIHLLALEWSEALGKVCEMPEALHSTDDSQVGSG